MNGLRASAYFVELAKELTIESSVLYNQLVFWGDKGSRLDGWVYKTYEELQDELGLSEYHIRSAYKKLEEAGYIETRVMKVDGTPIKHFRILKNLRMETEKIKETMETEKIKETNIKNINNHKEPTIVEEKTEDDMGKQSQAIIKLRRELKWKPPFIGSKREGEIAERLVKIEGYADVVKYMKLYEKHRDELMQTVNNLGDFESKYPTLKAKLKDVGYERQPL